ncbi:hypothetical protein GCM10023172_27470 [Hymenobacter ginsengisoli]|uniref:DUF3892 domain-containing protein n=2 Tax=Hymenobacteraceae TaxID=1853232 RepID=A0ABP8QGP0_9BACT
MGDDGVLTHYAFHEVLQGNRISRGRKTSKADAIKLLETAGNSATTWLWDYTSCYWKIGETVTVVGTGSNKYLRSNPDKKVTDNLAHLINYDWL